MNVPLPRGERIGPFEIQGALGTGGMGAVYQATDTRLGRSVALKLLPPDRLPDERARARLLREARAGSRLDHPNIAAVYEVGEHEGSPFIAMALYRRETLAERLHRRGKDLLGVPEVESILEQIACGLHAAHAAGVIHRDLKPGNVMLTEGGGVRILDFGLAKVVEGTDAASTLSETGAAMGTVAYMSPEQARGETVDVRTDVWSLGVMAQEMLTGRSPWVTVTPRRTS